MIEAIIFLCSILGLVSYLIGNEMLFFACGLISFGGCIRYAALFIIRKDKIEIENLRQLYENRSEKERAGLVKKLIFVNLIGRVITYSVAFGLLYWFFGWYGFLWLGILFGLAYLFEIKKIIRKY